MDFFILAQKNENRTLYYVKEEWLQGSSPQKNLKGFPWLSNMNKWKSTNLN